MDQPETHRSNVPDGMNVVDNDKSIAKTEAPVICFVESGAVSSQISSHSCFMQFR